MCVVCVSVCVRERERKKERKNVCVRETERERKRESALARESKRERGRACARASVCVCVCVCLCGCICSVSPPPNTHCSARIYAACLTEESLCEHVLSASPASCLQRLRKGSPTLPLVSPQTIAVVIPVSCSSCIRFLACGRPQNVLERVHKLPECRCSNQ